MAAITWKNLHNSNLSDPVTGTYYASKMLDNAFTGLMGQVSEAEANNGAAIERAREAQRNSVVQQLQSIGTPEQYAEMDKRGDIQAMFKGLDSRDQAALMGAPEARLDRLYQKQDINRQRIEGEQIRADQPGLLQLQEDMLQNIDTAALRQNVEFLDSPKSRVAALTGLRDFENTKIQNDINRTNQARQQELAKYNDSLLSRNRAISESELKGREDAAVTAGFTTKLNKEVAQRQQQHQAQTRDIGIKFGVIAKDLGFPVSANGLPILSEFNEEQFNTLNHEIIRRTPSVKGVPSPTLKDYSAMDTTAANRDYEEMSKNYPPELLGAFRESIRSGYNTSKLDAPVGNDAATATLMAARAKVENDDAAAENWDAPGNPTVKKKYDELAKNVGNMIDKTSGYGTDEDISAMQAFIYKMADEGIKIKEGVYLTPSVEDVQNAIRTAKGSIWWDVNRSINAENIIKNNLSNDRRSALIKRAEQLKVYKRQEAVKALINPTLPNK